ncbi:transcription repressor OFP3 [Ziziphus jujuba]|uniref:Transcription repressor n=1 Tax=Ziziphus jujuba TaxID=326968 RepID=A0A6P3YVT5_ZIZJJ|nr:transcription repressor OFP3 [Ziziphus jujuba]
MSSSNSSNNNKKKKNQFLKSILFFKLGCNGGGSCGCGRPKLSDVLEPIPIPKTSSSYLTLQNFNHPPNLLPNSSSSSFDNNNNRNDEDEEEEEEDEDYTCSTTTTTVDYDSLTIDDNHDHDHDHRGLVHEKCSISSTKLKDSIAVVKDSEDPLEDFKQSMKQMILEKQICSDEDLKALLNCFLELNSPFHHDVILRAFTQISNQIALSRRRRRPSTSTSISQDDHKPSDDH